MSMAIAMRSRTFLMSAVVKASAVWVRRLGVLGVADGWEIRAAECERCHLRVIQCGVSYCGKPFLRQIEREPAVDGCGCPCREKARTPGEHCPLDRRQLPAARQGGQCTCKWCTISEA
jgi:hypothetical protein